MERWEGDDTAGEKGRVRKVAWSTQEIRKTGQESRNRSLTLKKQQIKLSWKIVIASASGGRLEVQTEKETWKKAGNKIEGEKEDKKQK